MKYGSPGMLGLQEEAGVTWPSRGGLPALHMSSPPAPLPSASAASYQATRGQCRHTFNLARLPSLLTGWVGSVSPASSREEHPNSLGLVTLWAG